MRRLVAALCVAPVEWIALAWLERIRPLRARRYGQAPRTAINLSLAATGGIALAAFYPVVLLTIAARKRRVGWVHSSRRARASWLRTAARVLALDATLWLWHRLNHRIPWLWRFHAVHHMDGDLDVSTALRFHAGELALSTFWRAAQVAVLGVDVKTLLAWELAVLLSIQFHHANVRLPARTDAALRLLIATPRMHGVHHSRRPAELDSNFANLFTFWDRLFGTYRSPDRDDVTIGLSGFGREERLSFVRALVMPFRCDERLLAASR
jgi:sterol desaturase/sphingolipid hydroxylase (fatty acid hydroxylase superfamily)